MTIPIHYVDETKGVKKYIPH